MNTLILLTALLGADVSADPDVTYVERSTPGFMAALSYYDGYRRDRLPANLLQAQRDYFGAHTYQRTDKEGAFHTDWIRARKLS